MNRPLLLSIFSVVIMHSSFAMEDEKDTRPPLFGPVSKDIVPLTAAIIEARRNKNNSPTSPGSSSSSASHTWHQDLSVPEAIKDRNAKAKRNGLPLITPRFDHRTTVQPTSSHSLPTSGSSSSSQLSASAQNIAAPAASQSAPAIIPQPEASKDTASAQPLAPLPSAREEATLLEDSVSPESGNDRLLYPSDPRHDRCCFFCFQ